MMIILTTAGFVLLHQPLPAGTISTIVILALSIITLGLAFSRIMAQRRSNRILSHQRNILKNTLAELEISENKYKALFAQANDSIFLMDNETFIDCNDKTLEMFGCSRDEIIGHPPYKYSPKVQPDGQPSKQKALKFIEQCLNGNPQRFHWMHRKLDGTLFDAEVSLNIIKLEGNNYIQAIVRDISERVKAEKELVHARERAENATHSKTFFLAKMSHEIRTMLGGISSSTQLLKDTRVSNQQKELLDIIDTSADNLLSLVNEILDLSKIEAGKTELDCSPFDLRKCIEKTISTYKKKAADKDLSLFLSIHPRVPETVKGDELRVKQIIANLLSNSIKFTEEGSITCDVTLADETIEHLMIGLKITDTGIGIPKDRIEDMFNEYSQSDRSISRRYGGTGLGLNIVYKLVQLMNGTIELESEPGKGTTVSISIMLNKVRGN